LPYRRQPKDLSTSSATYLQCPFKLHDTKWVFEWFRIRDKRKNTAKPSGLSYTAVAAIAENLCSHLGYAADYDILASINKLGGGIEVRDFWEPEVTGGLKVDRLGKFTISVASHTSFERDRFTIAHELGHYILHYLLNNDKSVQKGTFYANRYGNGQEEVEANWFASAYLMPRSSFFEEFNRHSGNLYEAAKTFKVSRQAAEVRARVLGLITSDN
jgi:hypothetical protein